jgi:hypothetical protein
MDISGYKFVVSSGCSYGRLADYVFGTFDYFNGGDVLRKEFSHDNWLDIDGDKIISLNLSIGSQGSDWQSDSLIYVVGELLRLGVKTENIFCLVEWSQWNRLSIHPPHHYGLDLNLLNFTDYCNRTDFRPEYEFRMVGKNEIKHYHESYDVLNFFRSQLDLTRSDMFEVYNVGKIEDRVYMNVSHMNPEIFNKLGGDYKLFYEDFTKVEHRIPLENKIKIYLDNILRTQDFLQKNNLQYNFCFMQSTLSDWGFIRDGVMSHRLFNSKTNRYDIVGDRLVFNPKSNSVNNPDSDIEIIMPEVKTKMNQLNFDNFWLYENERFRRGGIDEWTIDNLKETGYINLTPNKLDYNFSIDEVISDYGGHPNMVAYIFLWNKITFNCGFVKVKPEFEKFLWEKYWEDYNYDGISKNNITLSKKEWNRISKN